MLVDLMCKNPNIAKGYHKNTEKSTIREQWTEIKNKLNSLGPPTREVEGWMKVWADMKTSVKKKLMHNKIESRATGGGHFNQKVLTPLEESVAGLLQMDTIISPEGQTFGISNIPTNLNEETIIEVSYSNEQINSTEENAMFDVPTDVPISTRKKTVTKDKHILLEEQLKVQKEIYNDLKKSLSEIERYSRKTYKLQEERLKLQKEKMKIYKDKIKKQEFNRATMIKLRMEELELKRRKIEIEEKKFSLI